MTLAHLSSTATRLETGADLELAQGQVRVIDSSATLYYPGPFDLSGASRSDPPENCHLTKIVFFFSKIANGNFVEKMTIFFNFFEKNVKFLAIF